MCSFILKRDFYLIPNGLEIGCSSYKRFGHYSDVVAIIGAHSLGTTSVTRSGFNGPWALPTTRFDNGFYRVLFGGGNAVWVQEELNDTMSPFFPTPRYQWMRPGGPRGGNGGARVIMLNSDMVR